MAKWSKSERSWERQPGESAQAYAAFDIYCKMGAERSTRAVAQKCSKSVSLIQRWSREKEWQKRVRDYDAELARIEFAEAKKGVKEMQERQINLSKLLQKKAFDALKNLDASELTPQEILRFISEGAKLEAANRAASTQQAAEGGGDQKAASLASAVIAAYQRRKETGDDD